MHLLVTGAWGEAKQHIPDLERMGHEVAFLQQEKDALPCEPSWVEGMICNGLFLYHNIKEFTNLRYIQLTSAGYDRVDMDYITAHGIEIHNAKGVYSIPMAEFALWGVLEVYKGGRAFAENQKAHGWVKQRKLRELAGKTVTIVGCGDVGSECAKRFAAFGCRVIGVNRTVRELEYFECVRPLSELKEQLTDTDILIVTIALTDETKHLLDAECFEKLKSDAVLVNISRGAVINTEAMTAWLQTTPTANAVLDVFEEEPLSPESPLWDLANVIITPHNSFVGDGDGGRVWNLIGDSYGFLFRYS